MTVEITEDHFDNGVYTTTVLMTPSIWTDFASNCIGTVGGSDCPVGGTIGKPEQPKANQTDLLFSWGNKDPSGTLPGTADNSWLFVDFAFSDGRSFALDSIRFKTATPAQLLGAAGGPAIDIGGGQFLPLVPKQGVGTMVAYERNPEVWDSTVGVTHHITDQRMDIHAFTDGAASPATRTVENWYVAVAQGTARDETDFGDTTFDAETGVRQFLIDREYFFTKSDQAEATADDKLNTLTFGNGDRLAFQFYEAAGFWDNLSLFGEATPPDAYYGSFDLTLTPLASDPSLAVEPVSGIDFGPVRAGDTTADRVLTASNNGDDDSTLEGVTFDPLTGDNTGALTASAPPTDVALANPGGVSETATRTYGAAPLGKNDTAVQVVAATQRITADNGTVTEQTRAINAEVKGPILGVQKQNENPDITDASDWADYGSEINLGDYSIGGLELLADLAIANIFGAAEGDFTMLTFYNVGLISNAGGLFSIESGDPTGAQINAQGRTANSLRVGFTGLDDLPYWTATLSFITDQNRPFNAGIANSQTFSFVLRVDNLNFAPVPSALALMTVGLLCLGALRHWRG